MTNLENPKSIIPSSPLLSTPLPSSAALPLFSLASPKDRVRILCINGGGLKGILLIGLLHYIEDNLTQKTGSPFYFAKHLDLIAGISTGGIISLGLMMPGERDTIRLPFC